MLSYIGWMVGELVHHEARLTCLEKDRQSTVEVAQEEVAPHESVLVEQAKI